MKALRTGAAALLTAVVSMGFAQKAHGQLVINEIMQSNIDCIMDDIHEFPDSWVELYNAGSNAERLSEYSINDKDKPKKAYTLPNYTIAPGQFIVLYCDKEESGKHTSFRLESGKDCNLYLYKNSEIVDKIEGLAKQPSPNVAYGRKTDGGDEWGYQLVATPEKANCGTVVDAKHVLPDPEFSQAGKVTSSAFNLELTLPEKAPEGAVIRYTTDGSEPTANSKQYDKPISVSRTTTVRAKLFADGYISPRSLTHSYIFTGRNFTIPVVSMVTDKKYFFDSKLGIYQHYQEDWRRPINLEIFTEENEESIINQLCETRIKGGATRDLALKSLALYANKRFGAKRFEYEFFPEDMPGKTDWKSIELRNSGNDFDYTYFRDAVIQRVMGRNCDLDWQPYMPTAFYLNGEYKGMLNIRTRSNEDLIYTLYDGLEDIDMVENWWELKEGSIDSFNEFQKFYESHDHSFAEYEQVMDCGEFANLFIMNLVCDNRDFPGNNIIMWRPQAEGGRWRWVAKDTDFGLGLYGATYQYKTFDWLHNPDFDANNAWANHSEHTRLFRRLMEIPEFYNMFIDRTAVYMGDFFNERVFGKEIDEMYDAIKYEYKFHRKLFNEWWPNHEQEVNNMKTWIKNRVPFFYTHMAQYYKLGNPHKLTIDAGRTDKIELNINGIGVKQREFDGQYFQGRKLTITAADPTGAYEVTGWKVTVQAHGSTNTTTYPGATLSIDMPDCSSIAIQSVLALSGIEDITTDNNEGLNPAEAVDVYNLAGIKMATYPSLDAAKAELSGLFILRQGAKSVKMNF